MQRTEQPIDKFIMASRYDISKNVRKFPEGGSGYGNSSYGTNNSYLLEVNQQVQANSNLATSNYNDKVGAIQGNYQQFLEQSQQEILQDQKNYNTVKGGINTLLGSPSGTYNQYGKSLSYKQNLNQNITNWVTGDNNINNSNPHKGPTGNLGRPNRSGNPNKDLSIHDPNYTPSLSNTMSYDQWAESGQIGNPEFQGTRQDYREYKKEMVSSREIPRGADGMPLKGNELQQHEQESIKKGLFEKGNYKIVSSEALDVAKSRGTKIGSGFSTPDGNTYEMTKKGLKQTASDYGETATDSAGFLSTTGAPVKGGLWTTAVDLGLHYLSDDNDPGTYTAGEVGTDIASLALDIVTFDWIGAVMQVGDMVAQTVNMKKLKKERKAAEKKWHTEKEEAESEYIDAKLDARKVGIDRRAVYGKSSAYGAQANLGGFQYNI